MGERSAVVNVHFQQSLAHYRLLLLRLDGIGIIVVVLAVVGLAYRSDIHALVASETLLIASRLLISRLG